VTKWTFAQRPKNSVITISRQVENKPEVFLGAAETIHIALTEVASFFKPGDIVVTPSGSCIVSELLGELNN
jgi:hypothetical protein